jgi:hypothetical protein
MVFHNINFLLAKSMNHPTTTKYKIWTITRVIDIWVPCGYYLHMWKENNYKNDCVIFGVHVDINYKLLGAMSYYQ